MSLSDQDILDYVAAHPGARRAEIRQHAAPGASETTVWRALKRLVRQNQLAVSGRGPATAYTLAGAAVIRSHLHTPFHRRTPVRYRREFLDRYVPGETFYLNASDRARLREAGSPAIAFPAQTYARRILEQLLIDLSWASSRMEGNTYSLLDTERLIRFGQEAAGKDVKETIMILNHKDAIQHVVENLDDVTISRPDFFDIHSLLANGLLPALSLGRLRQTNVGITRSSYRPLDNPYEIEEEFDILVEKAASIGDPFEQSFFVLVHVPYLQAFEDVNKRTSRIASIIPLLKASLAPMSFLTMNDQDYIDGLLGVYELNNVSLLRDAYIDAYLASAENYRALRAEIENPHIALAGYRDFVHEAVRRCVLEWKAFRADRVMELAVQRNIPEVHRASVVEYVGQEVEGLHKGSLIRYRLQPKDLDNLRKAPGSERDSLS
jgi:Fic family protein